MTGFQGEEHCWNLNQQLINDLHWTIRCKSQLAYITTWPKSSFVCLAESHKLNLSVPVGALLGMSSFAFGNPDPSFQRSCLVAIQLISLSLTYTTSHFEKLRKTSSAQWNWVELTPRDSRGSLMWGNDPWRIRNASWREDEPNWISSLRPFFLLVGQSSWRSSSI